MGPNLPALLTSTVTGPNQSSAIATIRFQSPAFVTSCSANAARFPSSAASASPTSARISVSSTCAPSALKRRACDAPLHREGRKNVVQGKGELVRVDPWVRPILQKTHYLAQGSTDPCCDNCRHYNPQ